jgi:hypothetical protein
MIIIFYAVLFVCFRIFLQLYSSLLSLTHSLFLSFSIL